MRERLRITASKYVCDKQIGREHSQKKGIVITARVHPGESNSSYMMKGLIDFLIESKGEAKNLRKKFVFKIVPMLNPDGVVYGNYRCSLLGADLNRRWKHPNILMHPTIYHTKKMLKTFAQERELMMFCDLHGHSIKKNAFMYACSHRKPSTSQLKENIYIRLIPFLLFKTNPHFSYENSHFRIEKSKESTARIVSFRELNILCSYTLEASFFGSESALDKDKPRQFEKIDLENIGKDLCKQIGVLVSPTDFKEKLHELIEFLQIQTSTTSSIRYPCRRFSRKFIKNEESQPKIVLCDLPERKSKSRLPRRFGEERGFGLENALSCFDNQTIVGIHLVEENSDSGGSDSQASFNDDLKIKYKLTKGKHTKKKIFREESPTIKAANVTQNSSFVQVRRSCLTPDIIIKKRPSSRISLKKRTDVELKKIIPSRILLRSPFIEENYTDLDGFPTGNMVKSSARQVIVKETTKDGTVCQSWRYFYYH